MINGYDISVLDFSIGLFIGLVFGVIVGFLIALRSKKPGNNITAVQLLSVITLFGYVLVSFIFAQPVSWVIAVAILATGYGAKGGEIIEKVLERGDKK